MRVSSGDSFSVEMKELQEFLALSFKPLPADLTFPSQKAQPLGFIIGICIIVLSCVLLFLSFVAFAHQPQHNAQRCKASRLQSLQTALTGEL